MPAPARHAPLPILDWGPRYTLAIFADDALAAAIVTLMLIPQSLAYATLAGLPAVTGLYASIAPLIAYMLFGASRALAVGPVALVSLMTAAAVGRMNLPDTESYAAAAAVLAVLTGLMLLAFGLFRLGALANFLSHPTLEGFTIASALLIALGQIGPLVGADSGGATLPDIARSLAGSIRRIDAYTTLIGVGALSLLVWSRENLAATLRRAGADTRTAALAGKTGPILVVALAIGVVALFGLDGRGVMTVGALPRGLPPLAAPHVDFPLIQRLFLPALPVAIIAFVSSLSVAQTLASKGRERIDPDQELVALGAANVAAGFTGGFPVAGGFSRSAVTLDAGARTPAAGGLTALGLVCATLWFAPWLERLPKAALAATIIVAALGLVDRKALPRVWRISRADGFAMTATMAGTLFINIETGLVAGLVSALALHLKRTAAPHFAVVGQAPGTEHFRNVERHAVATSPLVLSVRVDESLYFANSRYLEDTIARLVAERPAVRHVVLLCSAVNHIDASGLKSLDTINRRLDDAGLSFHLSEVKGPVMDRLVRSGFLDAMTGRVFLTQFGAMSMLDPDLTRATLARPREKMFEDERAGA